MSNDANLTEAVFTHMAADVKAAHGRGADVYVYLQGTQSGVPVLISDDGKLVEICTDRPYMRAPNAQQQAALSEFATVKDRTMTFQELFRGFQGLTQGQAQAASKLRERTLINLAGGNDDSTPDQGPGQE